MANQYAILTELDREVLMKKDEFDNYTAVLSELDRRISTQLQTDLRLLYENEPHLYEEVLQQINRSFDNLVENE